MALNCRTCNVGLSTQQEANGRCDVCVIADLRAQLAERDARIGELESEVKRVRGLIDRDRTGLAQALNDVRRELDGRRWLAETDNWASYSYEQHTTHTLRAEFGWALTACLARIEQGLRESGARADAAFHPERSALAAKKGTTDG